MGHRQAQERVGDRVDQVKTADVRVEQEAPEDSACRAVKDDVTRVGGGCVGCTLLPGRFLDLGLKIMARAARGGFQVWASKPGRRSRGGRDGTWRHPEACVEAKQRRRGVSLLE